MNLFRIIFLVMSCAIVAGASYLSYNGIGGESRDISNSIRAASGGRGFGGNVK
ncbi:hypothetical protein KMP13_04640 [Epibacterium ulvae]|uniref:hypothetical protein n=1 Tax=Epibacterium ulvae TaxID=1156985 RepID=UPI001BFCD439|nr:hypothetical protein [Epibacterium ulvae]MBT8153186.1 hypothetical protein [Epibacterium ulvae]